MVFQMVENECTRIAKSVADELEVLACMTEFASREDVEDRVEELEDLEELNDEEQEELAELKKRLEQGDSFSLYDYVVREALDVEYTISSNGDMLGVRIYVTIGGPTVYIDTRDRVVRAHWGFDRDECYISYSTAEAIDDLYEILYEGLRH